LLLQHLGLVQTSAGRDIQQLVVRNAAPQEERQTRCQIHVTETINGAGRDPLRRRLGTVDETRSHQHARERLLNPILEASALAALPIEIHQQIDF
jgi:hypothetical protein